MATLPLNLLFFQVVFVFVTEFSLAPLAQLAPLRSP